MSDRRRWFEEACPECRAAAGARCTERWYQDRPLRRLHPARGWRQRPCPSCNASAEEMCVTPGGRVAKSPHTARLRPGRHEPGPSNVWEELERWGASVALVAFHGGGKLTPAMESVILQDAEQREITRWSHGAGPLPDELAAPVWDRYALFRGQPRIRATVIWDVRAREVIVTGRRGEEPLDEVLRERPRGWTPPPRDDTSRDTSAPIAAELEGVSPPVIASTLRSCTVCGGAIATAARPEARYCSKRCRQSASRARIRERTGRAGLRAPERCAQCSGPMPTGLRPEATYCSKSCRQAASRARLQTAAGS
jgi:predicted nucleic acid-binding Zn ribbon protein